MIRHLRAWWAVHRGTVDEWVERIATGGSVKWK